MASNPTELVSTDSFLLTNIDSQMDIQFLLQKIHLSKASLLHKKEFVKHHFFKAVSNTLDHFRSFHLDSFSEIQKANKYLTKRSLKITRIRKSLQNLDIQITLCKNMLHLLNNIQEMFLCTDQDDST